MPTFAEQFQKILGKADEFQRQRAAEKKARANGLPQCSQCGEGMETAEEQALELCFACREEEQAYMLAAQECES